MFTITRRPKESIMIGDDIQIVVLDITHNKVRIGVIANKDVPIHRQEVHTRIQQEQRRVEGIDS